MAKAKYFHGNVELTYLHSIPKTDFAIRFPGVKGRPADSFSMWVGQIGETGPWNGKAFERTIVPVERVVFYKSRPSLHVCDHRCVNAKGRVMNCECSCGGKNHGRGSSLICD